MTVDKVSDGARFGGLSAYSGLVTLWKNADPDIPVLKEAQAEYARLP